MKNFILIITSPVLVLLSCAVFEKSDFINVSKGVTTIFSYNNIKYESLKNNDIKAVKFSSDVYKFDFGKSCYAMYKLPDREDDYNILLRSYVFRLKPEEPNAESFIFYPIVKVLDEKFNFKRNINTRIDIDHESFRRFSTHKIPIEKDDKYIIIHTDSTLSGKDIQQIDESVKDIPQKPFITEENSSDTDMIKFAPIGEVKILTPYKNLKDVFISPSNLLIEWGYCAGGEVIAEARDRDLSAGSGLIFSLGYSFRLPFHPRLTLRTIGGYRYDFAKTEYGKVTSTAITGEMIGVYSFKKCNLGIGFCSHIGPKFTASDLEDDIAFKNAFGPVILFEFYYGNLTGGAKFILMDYVKKGNKEKMDATQFGLYVGFYINSLILR